MASGACGANAVHQSNPLLNKIIEDYWSWRLQDAPEFATLVDVHTYDDQLESLSPQAWDNRFAKCQEFLNILQSANLSKQTLSREDRITHDILLDHLNTVVNGYKWRFHSTFNAVNFLENIPIDFSSYLVDSMVYKTVKDFNKFTQRLKAIPAQIEEGIGLMRKAISNNTTAHAVSVKSVPDQLEEIIAKPPAESIFYRPYLNKISEVEDIGAKQKKELCNQAERMISDTVFPALASLAEFIRDEYMANTRAGLGVSSLNNGHDYYKECLRWHLSIDMDPKEVHDLGLKEVGRIRKQMEAIVKEVKFEGDILQFMQHLKEERKFYHDNKEKLLEEYHQIIEKKITPKLTDFFHTVPDIPVVVKTMPFNGPGGQYNPPAPDGSRPGTFLVNLHNPETRPRFMMTALSLHEASPGHHFQISFAVTSSLPCLRKDPDYRKLYAVPCIFPVYTAYVEGWALYSEYLGEEMGMYQSPYDLFGRYSEEMTRACRLVIDTGLHVYDWSREQAIQYMKEHTCSPLDEIEEEVDRYVTWPGQACAYKIGEMKIKELRKFAEHTLNKSFDLKDFHGVILSAGPMPLALLENVVLHFIHAVQEGEGTDTNLSQLRSRYTEWVTNHR